MTKKVQSSTKKAGSQEQNSKQVQDFSTFSKGEYPQGEGVNNPQPITILTFTPAWLRPQVLEICLQGIKRLKEYAPERFNIIPLIIVSESSAAYQAIKYGFNWIITNNNPLGAKKNYGLRHAMENFKFDYLMEIGSDDLVTNEYLDLVEPLMIQAEPQITPCDVHFIDTITGETGYWKTEKVLGAARLIHRSALEKFAPNYKLWRDELNRGMDTCSWQALLMKNTGNHIVDTKGTVYTFDIKSRVNINPMGHFLPNSLTATELLTHFPEGEQIKKLIND